MNNEPIVFDKILTGSLRPWLDSNKPDVKFIPLLSSIETVFPAFQMLYEIDFIRPFNSKTKFYHKLIINEANSYCNHIIELINEDNNLQLTKYWLDDTLNKSLKTRIKGIGKLIRENDYSISYINPGKLSNDVDSDKKTDTYIFQLLKVALIKVYIEIQEVFKDYLQDDLLIEDDFFTQLLDEPIPEKSFLKDAPQMAFVADKEVTARNTKDPDFKPIMDDIRPEKKGIATYHNIIKTAQRFASFEEKLYLNDYINLDYSFTDKHGYRNELAMIYHILIEKGYFNTFNDATRKKFKPNDIPKFLNHRYNVEIDKQFRTVAADKSKIATFKENTSWLFSLPPC